MLQFKMRAGVYVTSLPFNPIPTESVFVPQGQVVFFVKGEYIASNGWNRANQEV